jgi:iron complex transport system substrate-binding protein
MRIASLVPSATEALFALGLGDQVVAVTHECDHPERATRLPRLTSSVIPAGLPAAEIDARVREVTGRGEALYRLDEATLAELRPDLIVTQALCAVCAVSFDDVRAVAERLPTQPHVLSLDPETLDEVLGDLLTLAAAAGESWRGEALRDALDDRLRRVRDAVAGAPRPRVAALEWLEPPYVGGHWVPEMVRLAGGDDVLGEPGRKSRVVDWGELAAAGPDVAVVMPCGLYADEAAAEARANGERLRALGAERVVAVDAASSFSRPGPRLVDGVELLAHLLHPDSIAAPEGIAWEEIAWESTAPSSRST